MSGFIAVNAGSEDIYYFMLASAGSDNRSDDLLGSHILSAGEELYIDFSADNGYYDVILQFDNSDTLVFPEVYIEDSYSLVFDGDSSGGGLSTYDTSGSGVGVYLPQGGGSGGGSGGTPQPSGQNSSDEVYIENQIAFAGYGASVERMFISPSTDSSWGSDVLEGAMLYIGESTYYSLPGSGEYDVLVEFENDEIEVYGLIISGGDSLIITSDDYNSYVLLHMDNGGNIIGEYYISEYYSAT